MGRAKPKRVLSTARIPLSTDFGAADSRAVFRRGLCAVALCDNLAADSGLHGASADSGSNAAGCHLSRPGCWAGWFFGVTYRGDDLNSSRSFGEINGTGGLVPLASWGTSGVFRNVFVGFAFLPRCQATGLVDYTRK